MRRPHHVSSREIERKFLIKRLPLEILRSRHFRIAQGYLASETGGRHVRLRKKSKTAFLTFKGGGGGEKEKGQTRGAPKQFPPYGPARGGGGLAKPPQKIPGKNFK